MLKQIHKYIREKGKFLNIREGQLIHLEVMVELENIHLAIIMITDLGKNHRWKLKLVKGSLRSKRIFT